MKEFYRLLKHRASKEVPNDPAKLPGLVTSYKALLERAWQWC